VGVTRRVFIDREAELEVLSRAWQDRPGLVVIYGRRRIGKTRLVMEWLRRFCRGRYAYYHALPAKHEVNLAGLAESLERGLGIRGLSRASFKSIDALLDLVTQQVSDAVIVIDEFTYWVRAEPRVVGELQRFVDHALLSTKALIIVSGSLVGVMFRDVLGGGAPLYGRASYRIRLGELKLRHVRSFHPELSDVDAFLTYVVFGGVPYYHVLIRGFRSIEDVLWEFFLSETPKLRDEVTFILREEFRDPSTYYSVLKAIVAGADTPSKIAEVTGIHRQHISKYLAILEELGFISRDVPLFSRRGRYVIKDKILFTWFNIVEPIVTRDPSPDRGRYLVEIRHRLSTQASKVFEEVGRRFALAWGATHGINFDMLGRYVHKGVEIDVVGVSRELKEVHLFEVKWGDLGRRDVESVLKALERKSLSLPESLSQYRLVLHVIARSYLAGMESVRNAYLHDLREVINLT